MKTTLQESARTLLESKSYEHKVAALLQLIADETTDVLPCKRNELLEKLHIRNISDIKEQTVSIIIYYALLALQDNILTENELKNIALLKAFFNIKEDDFCKFGYEKTVNNILALQLEKMYADYKISPQEATMQTDLQEVFGLSYDQFCKIVTATEQKIPSNENEQII